MSETPNRALSAADEKLSAADNTPNRADEKLSAADETPNRADNTPNASEKSVAGLLGMLGLCAKAGKLICGTDRICEALRAAVPGKTPLMVLEVTGTSANTHKKLTDKCTYYKVRHETVPVSAETLARALGRDRAPAAVGITDGNLCRAVEKKLNAVC